VIQLFGGPIDWKASKQKTVSTSTTEAELLSISYVSREVLWWSRLFTSIGFDIKQDLTINCNNAQTVNLLKNQEPVLHTRLRHIDIQQHWLRELVQDSKINIKWVPTSKMVANRLTKPLFE